MAVLMLLFSLCAHGVEKDKKLHFAVSTGLSATAQAVTHDWTISMSTCMAVGTSKEIYDEIDYGGFSYEDLTYDMIGCLTGTILSESSYRIYVGSGSAGLRYQTRF